YCQDAIGAAGWRGVKQGLDQKSAIVLDRPDRVVLEELRKPAIEGVAVLEHVGHARWAAAVILQDEVLARVIPDDVGPDHVREDLTRRDDVEELALVLLARKYQLRRNEPVFEALLALIHIQDEEIQRGDPLDQPRLQALPLARRDHARYEVEREDSLGAFFLAVDGEGDALVHERELLQALSPLDLALREGLEDRDEGPVVRARRPAAFECLVECLLFSQPFHVAKNSICPAIQGWLSPVVMVVKSEHGDGRRG